MTLKTYYAAYADDVSAMTKVSVIPIPTALVIRNWDTVWDMISTLKTDIQTELRASQSIPRDHSYYTSFTL